ncbi:MAG TPA: ATP-dependent Clp protease proteolytic subunit [Verrucomicrobiales bacterium]|nr:ATP-dependent Clp protease proteolytic subunit [Verrucomicrobiales bacterium]
MKLPTYRLGFASIALLLLPLFSLPADQSPSALASAGASSSETPALVIPLPSPAQSSSPSSPLEAEKERLALENALAKERLAADLRSQREELERLQVEVELLTKRLELEAARKKTELDGELAELRRESERLNLENTIAKARAEIQANDLKFFKGEYQAELEKMEVEINLAEKSTERQNYADQKPVYRLDPLEEGRLIVSDRRIALNGPITAQSAEHVSERISYFNNKSNEFPIFIVIDDSPGGSVMAGYRILKAMEGSPAPVYVVVKSFAASMAACISTLAERSFAYPNAIILHHQLSYVGFGNLTEHAEEFETAKEWWRRLATPIAEKMGITLDAFIQRMYNEATDGDWEEFADEAVALKWIDTVVEDIRETSLLKNPDAGGAKSIEIPKRTTPPSTAAPMHGCVEELDAQGRALMRLPRVSRKDFYYLYNPDGYYRIH